MNRLFQQRVKMRTDVPYHYFGTGAKKEWKYMRFGLLLTAKCLIVIIRELFL